MDARLLRGGGIGRYVREITGRWLASDGVSEVRFLGRPRELEGWLAELPDRSRARVVPWTDPPYSLRSQLRWPVRRRGWAGGTDVAFFPHWDVPATGGGPPRLVAVHDLIQFTERDGFPAWKRVPGEALLGRALRTARKVVTVSDATRAELEARFPWLDGRVRAIPNGVRDEVFRPLTEEERAEAAVRWERFRPYLLYVGRLRPHKGVATALRVVEAALAEWPELRLLHVGPPAVEDPELASLLLDGALADRFVQRGVLSDVHLNEAYHFSECLIHPARKEGFGLPPLEAMASGTPVLASNRSGIPEVVGDAGILLDPDRPGDWLGEVLRLRETPEKRERWIARGRERARTFSWERTAAETLEALRSAAG